jgi:RHS repeat-associated protein
MTSLKLVGVDLDGNLTNGPILSTNFSAYTYDARNRLLNAGGVTNVYDALNNRIGQTFGTNKIAYVVNPNAKLPQVLMRIKNGVTNYYIYGAGLLYQITQTATATNTLTYHYDYRGSTVALSGDNGLVTDRIEYSAYGLTNYRLGTNDTPFLFNGRYGVQTDSNGLLYMRSRYYNPYLCRFVNPDPSGFKGGMNFYAYANGNPVSYLDPFGLSAAATGDTVNSSLYYNQLMGTPTTGSSTGANGGAYDNTSFAVGTFGISQSIVQFGSGIASIGTLSDGTVRIWTGGFYGNQYVSTTRIAKYAETLGPWLAVGGVFVDALGYANGDITGGKLAANTTFTGIGFFGLPGAAIAGTYFVTDTVYPGGAAKFGSDAAESYFNGLDSVYAPQEGDGD